MIKNKLKNNKMEQDMPRKYYFNWHEYINIRQSRYQNKENCQRQRRNLYTDKRANPPRRPNNSEYACPYQGNDNPSFIPDIGNLCIHFS